MSNHQRNVTFAELVRLVLAFGFVEERVAGSHHIYRHPQAKTKLNLQPQGKDAKPYQVRDLLRQVERYNLQLQDKGS